MTLVVHFIGRNQMITANEMYHLCHLLYQCLTVSLPRDSNYFTIQEKDHSDLHQTVRILQSATTDLTFGRIEFYTYSKNKKANPISGLPP